MTRKSRGNIMAFEAYLKSIKADDTVLESIDLSNQVLEPEQIEMLMNALATSQMVRCHLQKLDLRGNKIRNITVANFPALKHLDIALNHSLDDVQLRSLPELTTLNLRGNNITYIDLSELPKLEEAHLGTNGVAVLPDIRRNPGIKKLILNRDALTTVSKFLFDKIQANALNKDTSIKLIDDRPHPTRKPDIHDINPIELTKHFQLIVENMFLQHSFLYDETKLDLAELLIIMKAALGFNMELDNFCAYILEILNEEEAKIILALVDRWRKDNRLWSQLFQEDSNEPLPKNIYEVEEAISRICILSILDNGIHFLELLESMCPNEPIFAFEFAQILLHDLYLQEYNQRYNNVHLLRFIVSWILSLQEQHSLLELDKNIKFLMAGHEGMTKEKTVLSSVYIDITKNPFLLSGYLSFITKTPVKMMIDLPPSYLEHLQNKANIPPENNPFQIIPYQSLRYTS